MLYIFYGTDTNQSGTKARALINSLRTKRPEAAFEKIDANNWNPALIEHHLGGQGLFSNKYIVFLDRISENAEAKEKLPDFIAGMQESPNIFVVLEGKLTADLKRPFEKYAEKMIECEVDSKSAGRVSNASNVNGKREVNIFGIADAFGRKDAVRAWSMYQTAIEADASPEAIAGMLFWKAKMLGSVPLARTLIVLYHDAHRGRADLELGLERLLLSIH